MNEQRKRKWTIVLMTITIFVATAVFLPVLVRAGNLEPSAPPGSTMKTLDEVPPTWSQRLPASERFELIWRKQVSWFPIEFDYLAVLDKETGLVWERQPDGIKRNWEVACFHCYTKEVGGRKGWRLPTIEELASLVDTTNEGLALPTGHPFGVIQGGIHWSSTTHAIRNDAVWRVYFHDGSVDWTYKNLNHYVWCVRGGHGYNGY